nr:MAG TPA: minor tail protein [Caudoviricetes sp.]
MADYSLVVDVEAVDKASTVFDKIHGNVNNFKNGIEGAGTATTKTMADVGKSMQNVGNQMASTGKTMTATVTTPIMAAGTAAVKTASDFEAGMSEVQAISGATGTELQDLKAKALEMGSKTKFSCSESAEAMKYMGMAGWKAEQMIDGLPAVMYLAGATGEDLATTSDIVTDALTAFGLGADKATHFTDVLSSTATNANTNVSMMGETFKYCAPVAGALGFSVEDTAEAIGLMANSGIKGSQAGTALRSTFTALAGEVKLSGAAFGEVEIATTNADGSMRSLTDILDDCRVYFDQMTEAERSNAAQSLVGKNAMSGFLALMNAAPEDINKVRSAIEGCDGATEDMYKTMNDNLEGQLTELKSSLDVLAISFGELMLPAIKDIVAGIQTFVNWLNSLDDGAKNFIIRAALVAAALGPILMIGGKLISGIGTLITIGSKVSGLIAGVGSASAAAAPAVGSAGTALGTLSSNALGLIALGAGILLAAAGLALLAQSAIAIGNAGAPAAVAMAAMVGVIALLAVGAAALAPALAAGAVGLVAFGAGLTLVGAGVTLACVGITLLATQLPTVAQYGGTAAVAILELGGALTVFSAGALAAGAASTVLGAGLTVAAVGAAGAAVSGAALTVAILALSVAVLAASVAVIALGAGLNLCAPPIAMIGTNATTAAAGTALLTAAMIALLVPVTGGTVAVLAFDVSLVTLGGTFLVATAGAIALDAALVAMNASITSIASAASSASQSMSEIQGSLDVVKAGVSGLGDLFDNAVKKIISTFSSNTGNAQSAAVAFGSAITNGAKTGLQPIQGNTNTTMSALLTLLTTTMTRANSTTVSGMSKINASSQSGYRTLQNNTTSMLTQLEGKFRTTLNSIQSMFASCKLSFNQNIALPHFSMSGSFNAQTGATPSVHVQWYGKAYDQAYMFNTPTVFNGRGFGDGNGAEIVTGDAHLVDLMKEAFKDFGGDTIIPVSIGEERLDTIVVTAQQRANFRSGGR